MKRALILISFIVVAALALFLSGYGVLLHEDPMSVIGNNPPVVQDVACTYFIGIGTTFVYLQNGHPNRCDWFSKAPMGVP
jgi:hypothetical protein